MKVDEESNQPFCQLLISFVGNILGDRNTIASLLRKTVKSDMIVLLELYYFAAGQVTNWAFDKEKYVYRELLPVFINFSLELCERKYHKQALEYINFIIESKRFYVELFNNNYFTFVLRETRQRLVNIIEILYKAPDSTKKVTQTAASTHEANSSYMQPNQNQGQKRNLFSYFNSALDIIKTEITKGISSSSDSKQESSSTQQSSSGTIAQEEKKFYYDNSIGRWVIDGKPVEDDEDEIQKRKEEEIRAVSMTTAPPMMIPKRKGNN